MYHFNAKHIISSVLEACQGVRDMMMELELYFEDRGDFNNHVLESLERLSHQSIIPISNKFKVK